MKHERGRRLAVALADLFFEIRTGKIAALGIDAVVPVPLHWKRRAWRGYNQSAEVAERLAHRLRLPFHENLLRRTRPTPVQTNLSATKRRENVRNAFAPRRRLEGATVLLVDDVMTTGATCHYAAKALKEAGASKVIAAILARREDPRVSPALEEP
jgi:ComF family protein